MYVFYWYNCISMCYHYAKAWKHDISLFFRYLKSRKHILSIFERVKVGWKAEISQIFHTIDSALSATLILFHRQRPCNIATFKVICARFTAAKVLLSFENIQKMLCNSYHKNTHIPAIPLLYLCYRYRYHAVITPLPLRYFTERRPRDDRETTDPAKNSRFCCN